MPTARGILVNTTKCLPSAAYILESGGEKMSKQLRKRHLHSNACSRENKITGLNRARWERRVTAAGVTGESLSEMPSELELEGGEGSQGRRTSGIKVIRRTESAKIPR